MKSIHSITYIYYAAAGMNVTFQINPYYTYSISYLHLNQDHGRNLLACKKLLLSFNVNLNVRFFVPVPSRERPVLLGIKHCVLWVCGQLVLGCVSDESLPLAGEGYVGWSDTVTLVIGNDFDTTVLVYTNTEREIISIKFYKTDTHKKVCQQLYIGSSIYTHLVLDQGEAIIFINYRKERESSLYHEYVVPRSIPITVPVSSFFSLFSSEVTELRSPMATRNTVKSNFISLCRLVSLKSFPVDVLDC